MAQFVTICREIKKFQKIGDGEDFEEIGSAFEANCPVSKGTIGEAPIRLMKQREIVDYAVEWIEKNRKIGRQ